MREYLPFDESVVHPHLKGSKTKDWNGPDFVVGAYAMLEDETCRFIVADFDSKHAPQDHRADAAAFRDECASAGIPVYLERSRSGGGCHAWVFFESPVPVRQARRMMLATLTKAMEKRPELGFGSYDRLIPGQDRMPKGGLGNIVSLPLQNRRRADGNTVFVDQNWEPFLDQWAFLSDIIKMSPAQVERLSGQGAGSGSVFGIQMVMQEEDAHEPWKMKPSRPITQPQSVGLDGRIINMKLGDQVYIDRIGLPNPAVMQFARIGAFQNPQFYSAQALGLWTGEIPRVVTASEIFPEHVALPRGCLDNAMGLAKEYGAQVKLEDVRTDGVALPEGIRFTGVLRPRQKLALDSLMAHDIGVLKAPPAFGKTVVSIAGIAARQRNTLIIVFVSHLVKQWRERLLNFLDIDPKLIGTISGGKIKPTGVIDIALIQSLTRSKAGGEVFQYVSDIVGDYGQVIVDEVHHIGAKTFEPVARRAKAKYFLGASANGKRKDGRHPLIYMQFGPVRYTVDPKQLIAESGMAHIYRQRRTPFRFSLEFAEAIRTGDASPQDVYRALAEDEPRNYMIFDDVLRSMDRGRCPVVLTTRRDHLDNLYERFKPHVKNVVVLKGAMKASERKLAEDLMTKPGDEERLILATGQFLGEGFDDARLDALFMTMPTIWEGTLEQYSGRLQRDYVGKSSVEVIDYVDEEEALSKKAADRTRVFKRLGFTIDEPDSSAPYAEA
ncbi:DEAD/DEAH box helicase family protein [Agrobacterium rubi]|nr:DEAD/DEAH box helicase family protein [Agrobacterium rubi]NTF24161.1 DEAD/DEAH box helicase family protein [Agrobacterium rubi]